MKDSDIKKILKQDSSMPKAPTQEWSNILNEIDKSSESHQNSFFSFQTLSATLGAFLILTVSFNYFKTTNNSLTANEQNAIQFLIEDSYLSQSQDSYEWVDSF